MVEIYIDGTLSIDRLDYPELAQVTAWSGQAQGVSKLLESSIGLGLPEATKVNSNDSNSILSTAPNRWYVVGEEAVKRVGHINEALGTTLDLSSARSLFRLRGDNIEWLLAKGTAVDLSGDVTPDGSVVMTTIDHVGVLIHKIAVDAFDLYAFSSFADAIDHWLELASNDLVIES